MAKQGFTPYPNVQCINKYTVAAGDTCDTISLNTRIALASILSYNPGLDCTALQVGQYICLDNAGMTVPTLAPTTQTPIPTIILSTLAPTTAAPTTVPIIVSTVPTTTAVTTIATTVATGTLPAGCLDAFRQAALAAHNTFRSKHFAQSMAENTAVDTSAQAYAQQIAATAVFAHSTNRVNTGENLYMSSSTVPLTVAKCARKLNIIIFLF